MTDPGLARTQPTKRSRDPLGKSALFSTSGIPERMPVPIDADAEGRGASHLFTKPESRPGTTLLVDCSACGRRTRVTYAEFAALHFPVWLWVPSPARTHRHWLRCPTCHRFAWMRAGWLA